MHTKLKDRLLGTGLAVLWLFAPMDYLPCFVKLVMFPFVLKLIWNRKE